MLLASLSVVSVTQVYKLMNMVFVVHTCRSQARLKLKQFEMAENDASSAVLADPT